jgi:2-dehydro-3-deoxyphosphogluconate aldolase/(4S)-4-hydroxy-2-oxoglutarate aldolase
MITKPLLSVYRTVYEQGFLPIFVKDDFNTEILVAGCLEAGLRVIEYTLRRSDAHIMIPKLRQQYPDLCILAGSTLDDDNMIRQLRRRNPVLLTVAELDAIGVDGFVSMLGWREESIRRYAPHRLVIPTANTPNEAYFQVGAGAHFAKLVGSDLSLVKKCRMDPTHGFCPIMVTGGASLDRIEEIVSAGAVLVGSGFDLTLRGETNLTAHKVATVVRAYCEAVQAARARMWPALARAAGADDKTWLAALPHVHPFAVD